MWSRRMFVIQIEPFNELVGEYDHLDDVQSILLALLKLFISINGPTVPKEKRLYLEDLWKLVPTSP